MEFSLDHENSAFFLACVDGDVEAVLEFLADGSSADCTDSVGTTPLQIAAANGHVEVAAILLSHSADINKANCYGWTSLMHAARYGHRRTVQLLLSHGADVGLKNHLGCNATMMAAASGHVPTLRMVLEAEADESVRPALVTACIEGQRDVISELVNNGADANTSVPQTDINLLMIAAAGGHKDVVEDLVDYKVDLEAVNVIGHTALDVAAMCGSQDVQHFLECLMDTAEVPTCSQLQDSKGDTGDGEFLPFAAASVVGDVNSVKWWLKQGVDVNLQDSNGWTALMQATVHGHSHIIKYLLQEGANVNLVNNNGQNAFDLASLCGDSNAELMKLLAMRSAQLPHSTNEAVSPCRSAESGRPRSASISSLSESVAEPKNRHQSAQDSKEVISHVQSTGPPIIHDCTSELSFPGESRTLISDTIRVPQPPFLPRDAAVVEKIFNVVARTGSSRLSTRPHENDGDSSSTERSVKVELEDATAKPTETFDPEVEKLLQRLSLEQYCPLFEEEEIDMESLLTLSDVDLKDIGMYTRDRKTLLKVIYGTANENL